MARDKITIKGVLGFDGEYVFDWKTINGNEAHLIYELSGVGLNEIDAAIQRGNWAFHIALAVIALQRSGHRHADEAFGVLMALPLSTVTSEPIADPDEENVRDIARPSDASASSGAGG